MKFTEENLEFYSDENYDNLRKFDEKTISGLNLVDYVFEKDDNIYLLEIKDYQNPNSKNKDEDLKKLLNETKNDDATIFKMKVGGKFKDSLLKLFSEGKNFNDKNAVLVLFINFDKLVSLEREKLYNKIIDYIPTGIRKSATINKVTFLLEDKNTLKRKFSIDVKEKEKALSLV